MSDQEPDKNSAHVPLRGKFNIRSNTLVSCHGSLYIVNDILTPSQVVAKELDTGRTSILDVSEIVSVHAANVQVSTAQKDFAAMNSLEYERAKWRYSVIEPLLELNPMTKEDVQARADEMNIGISTIYRWIRKFKSLGVISALMSEQRGRKQLDTQLDRRVNEVINDTIEKKYLTARRPSVMNAIREVAIECRKLNLPAPHPNTVRHRISKIDERLLVKRRGNRQKARNLYDPAAGQFPGADYPLSVIQIDHTPMDVIVVDDVHREPIGRPFLTLAIDVCTRCVTGYYIGLEAPNENSVAMCIAHSILPKEAWLEFKGVEAEWPVFGFPGKIHVDNGSDFRTKTLTHACREYDIQLEYRPVKQPQYGGHIERLLGTFMRQLHDVPGTTFSSIHEKQDYKSDKHAILTMSELEKWLLVLIAKTYHYSKHSSIGMPPMRKWELGVYGTDDTPGIGLPALANDPHTVQLDFMPLIERTIQKDGVEIDGIQYYDEVLRFYIGMKDEATKRGKRFIFRRDPRDISTIWFFDEREGGYHPISYADQRLPRMSLWELKRIKKHLADQSRDYRATEELISAHEELREIVKDAEKKTKKARKISQQQRRFAEGVSPAGVLTGKLNEPSEPDPMDSQVPDEDIFGDLKPFDEW